MPWEQKHADLLGRFVAAVPLPPPYSQGGTDDDRRVWAKKLAQQFKYTFPAEGWGTKTAHAQGFPQTTDSICTRLPFVGYDVVTNGGLDIQRIKYDPHGDDLTGQYFIEVDPVDFVGEGGGSVPQPEHAMRLGYSCFWALGGVRRLGPEGRATLEAQMQEARAGGADFLRIILHLRAQGDDDHNPWNRIGLSWKDADFTTDLADLCRLLKGAGLKAMFVLCGGTNRDLRTRDDMRQLVDRACPVLAEHRDVIELVEMWNEVVNTGGSIDDCKFMCERAAMYLPGVLLALSSPPSSHMGDPPVLPDGRLDISADVGRMQMHEATILNVHIRRRGPGANLPPYIGPVAPDLVMSGEPRGPMSSVAQTSDPDELEADWNACADADYYAYVFHPDAGIWSIYISPVHQSAENGRWRLVSDHTNGAACMSRLKMLRGGSGGSSGGGGGASIGQISLRSDHGLILSSQGPPSDVVVADRAQDLTDTGPWEWFKFIAVDAEHVAIEDHHGRLLTAEPDGRVWAFDVGAREPRIQAYEVWRVIKNPIGRIGRIALQSHHGTYLGAWGVDGLPPNITPGHVYTIGHLEGWETWDTHPRIA